MGVSPVLSSYQGEQWSLEHLDSSRPPEVQSRRVGWLGRGRACVVPKLRRTDFGRVASLDS